MNAQTGLKVIHRLAADSAPHWDVAGSHSGTAVEPLLSPGVIPPISPFETEVRAPRPRIHAEVGRYRLRLAESVADRDAVCRLRFKVFNIELGKGLEASYETGLDTDHFDLFCEHLLVEEITSTEVGELLLLSARNQDGLIAALASRSPAEALSRLAALASIALSARAAAAASLLAQAFDLVVQVVAATDGSVRVVEIAEPRADGAELLAVVCAIWRGQGEPGIAALPGLAVIPALTEAQLSGGYRRCGDRPARAARHYR